MRRPIWSLLASLFCLAGASLASSAWAQQQLTAPPTYVPAYPAQSLPSAVPAAPPWQVQPAAPIAGPLAAPHYQVAQLPTAGLVASAPVPYHTSAYANPYAEPVAAPGYQPASHQRMFELEQRVAELETMLREQAEQERQAKEEEKKGYVVGSDLKMSASWNNGLEFQTANKDFRVHVGGRTQFDSVWLDADPGGVAGTGGIGAQDSVNFRRARLRIDGTMYETIEWAVEYDFTNTINDNVGLQPASESLGNVQVYPAYTDLWWTFKEVPVVGNVRVGNFKEPIGMEHLTSSRWLDFMERSFMQDAFFGPFNNGFSPGIMVFNWTEDENATWAVGAFKNVTNGNGWGVGSGEAALDGRVTWLPWYDEPSHGRYLLHLGLSASHKDCENDRMRIRSRGSLRNGPPGPLNPVYADTGVFLCDTQDLFGVELAGNYGPLMFQSEWYGSYSDDAIHPVNGNVVNPTFYGYYAEALYFLTGEHRPYDRKAGVFTRVVPYENAFLVRGGQGLCHGTGAWQVGVRYSMLDLRDAGIDGGVLQDVTLGLNWFLNPNMKIQWNYVYLDRDSPGALQDGYVHGFGMRLAHDF